MAYSDIPTKKYLPCPICGRSCRLRKDGTLQRHTDDTSGEFCCGSYCKPTGWLRDFEKNGIVYLRPVKDGVAYLPGVAISRSNEEADDDLHKNYLYE